MAVNGPPEEEHLLSRVRRWFNHYAGRFFWPSNDGTERPDAERPDANGVIDNPPVLPDYQEEEEERDVIGLEVELMVAQIRREVENANGHGRIDHPHSRRGEEREEQLNHYDDQNARPPSPPLQQFPPPNFGMDWRQQGPVYYPDPHANPYAFPHAFPFAYPFAQPFNYPYAHPLAYPYAQPFAFPHVPPAFFNAAPHPDPYAPPQAEPHVFPDADSDNERGDAREVEENGNKIPELENIGPLSAEESLEFFSGGGCLEEDPESPSTSGSSTKRRRDESDVEQAAAKRLRWSDETE